jgi:PadR family transcriptional regulator PadR
MESNMDPKLLAGTLDLMIMDLLAEGPSYGYEISQTVLDRSQGYFDLKEGSLYPALHRLERQAWLEAYWTEQEGRRRKYYGRTALKEKLVEWKAFASGVNGVLGMQFGMA